MKKFWSKSGKVPVDMPPFFTIITATYNAAATLPRLLESLTSQTCRDFVWIVQDGASTDATLTVIEAWKDRLPAISLQSLPDNGIYDAWNKALDRTEGQLARWVLFLGADDALAGPDVLEDAKQHLGTQGERIAYASAGAFMVGGGRSEELPPTGIGACMRLRREMPFCHTALFHRAALFRTMRFDARYKVLGDYDFLCCTLTDDTQFVSLPLTVTRMRRGGASTSLCMQPAIFRESCKIALRHFGRLQIHHAKVGLKVAVVALLCRMLGSADAARFMDRVRCLRGKSPCWHNPLECTAPLRAAYCAVVLVHYNNAQDTLACLQGLRALATPPAHIVVVDNSSQSYEQQSLLEGWKNLCAGQNAPLVYQPGVSPALPAKLPSNIFVPLACNTGFAGGNNAALRLLMKHTDCTAFWLLNNDTEPAPHALDALCARLNAKPGAGLCGSTLVCAHAPDTVQAAGGCTYSRWTGRTSFLCGGEAQAKVGAFASNEVNALESRMGFVVGASCLVRRDVLLHAGFMSEDFFLYYEDAAFSLQSLRAGFDLAWARDSLVAHKEGASSGAQGTHTRPRYVDYLSIRNRVALVRRYSPWALPVALLSLLGVCWNRIRRGQADRLGLICRALWHGLLNRMGPPAGM